MKICYHCKKEYNSKAKRFCSRDCLYKGQGKFIQELWQTDKGFRERMVKIQQEQGYRLRLPK